MADEAMNNFQEDFNWSGADIAVPIVSNEPAAPAPDVVAYSMVDDNGQGVMIDYFDDGAIPVVDAAGNPVGYSATPEVTVAPTPTDSAPKSTNLMAAFTEALDIGRYEGMTKDTNEIIAARSPEEFATAISTAVPAYAGVMDKIKSNPELLNNFHAAFAKDPSMVEGFIASMGTSEADPKEIEAQLADPTNQARLSWLLGRIAQDPADDADFEDFNYIAMDKNISAAQKAQRMLELGYNPLGEKTFDDWMKVLTDFLRDPQTFFAQLPAMLGMGPEQTAAMAPILNGMGKYFGLVLGPISGEEQGYGGLLANGIESGTEWVSSGDAQEWIDDISGSTDAAVAAQKAASQVGTVVPEGAGMKVTLGPAGSGVLTTFQGKAAEGIMSPDDVRRATYAPTANNSGPALGMTG